MSDEDSDKMSGEYSDSSWSTAEDEVNTGDLSHIGPNKTSIKSFSVKHDVYQQSHRDSQMAITESCSSASSQMVPVFENLTKQLDSSTFPRTNVVQQNFVQVQQQFGDVTVQGTRNLTIGGQQNITSPPPSAHGQHELDTHLTWTEKIKRRTKVRLDEWTKGMVRTVAFQHVLEKLKKGVPWITVTGSPGEGKTTVAYMALLDLYRSEREVFQVISPEEFIEVTLTSPRPFIMLDDIFGSLDFDEIQGSKWRHVLQQVMGSFEHNSHVKERGELSAVVILVGRDYVIREASQSMGRLKRYFTNEENVVTMSNRVQRDQTEKVAIWNAVSEASAVSLSDEMLLKVCGINATHGFPHICRLYAACVQEDADINTEDFFANPLPFLNQTVETFMRDNSKCNLFKEMLRLGGSVGVRELCNIDNSMELNNMAENLVGTYLRKDNDSFSFEHPSIYDSVAYNICKYFPLFVIRFCKLPFIHRRLRLQTEEHVESSLSWTDTHVLHIPKAFTQDLLNRLAEELQSGELVYVLSHSVFKDDEFVVEFMSHPKVPLKILFTLTDTHSHISFLGLIASSKSCAILKYFDKIGLILSHSELNVVLYGVCYFAASDVLDYMVQTREALDVNITNGCAKQTALMVASSARDTDFVMKLMSLGADVNAKDAIGQSVLQYLCEYGHTAAVKELIGKGIDVNEMDDYGRHSLLYACMSENLELVQLLLDHGATVDDWSICLACRAGSLDILTLLFQKGDPVDSAHCTRMTSASEGGNVKAIKFLLERGESVNRMIGSESPLHAASSNNHAPAVQLLIDHEADPDAKDYDHNTPLHLAAQERAMECVGLLLQAGSDVNATNKLGQTPLHGSVQYIRGMEPDYTLCELLVSKGAVNQQDKMGNTPLHLLCSETEDDYMSRSCSSKLKKSLVKLLVDHGADTNMQNMKGIHALH